MQQSFHVSSPSAVLRVAPRSRGCAAPAPRRGGSNGVVVARRAGVPRRAPASPARDAPGVLDRLRRAASAAAFFGGPTLASLAAPWPFGAARHGGGATFQRDAAAERRRGGPDRLPLFDFEDPATADHFAATWHELDDVIMGGCSRSHARLLRTREGVVLQFAGEVSSSFGGGWASVRSADAVPPWDLSAYDGLRLRVRGDGQRYKVALRDEGGWAAPAWEAHFDTVAGAWTVVRLPWACFRRGGFGWAWRGGAAPPELRRRHVTSVQLLLSKFDDAAYASVHVGAPCHERAAGGRGLNPFFAEGPFALYVQRIEAYRRMTATSSPPAQQPQQSGAAENEWVERADVASQSPSTATSSAATDAAAMSAADAAAETAARAAAGAAQAAQAAQAAEVAADAAAARAGRPLPPALPPAPPDTPAAQPEGEQPSL